MDDDQLWEIERALWLQGVDTYEQRLAPEVLLVFPPPTGSLDRGQTLAAIGAAPRWHRVAFHNQRTAKPVTGMRVLAYLVTANRDGEPVVIYGAGKAGTLALREILTNSAVPMKPIGFIDDDPQMRGRVVNGYPVLGDLADLANVVLDGTTRGVVIASEKISIAKIQSTREVCEAAGAWTRVFRIGFLAAD